MVSIGTNGNFPLVSKSSHQDILTIQCYAFATLPMQPHKGGDLYFALQGYYVMMGGGSRENFYFPYYATP